MDPLAFMKSFRSTVLRIMTVWMSTCGCHWGHSFGRSSIPKSATSAWIVHAPKHRSILRGESFSSRLFSTAPETNLPEKSSSSPEQVVLKDPRDFVPNGTFPMLNALSPSSILEFKNCPQSFFFQYILKMKQPANTALAKGSMVHGALEKVFDLEEQDRSLENLQNLLRVEWSGHRTQDNYKHLFLDEQGEYNQSAEIQWGQEALALLENYYAKEDPKAVNPRKRETWVREHLSTNPWVARTAPPTVDGSPMPTEDDTAQRFLVRGIIDRIDYLPDEQVLRLCDYKTGKAPHFKYSQSMNAQIFEKTFYQLLIYALLLREQTSEGPPLRYLRLMFLTSVSGDAEWLDYDLGATQDERDAKLHSIYQDLSVIWMNIQQMIEANDATIWQPCDRTFCYCHKCRPLFRPGSVAEPVYEWEQSNSDFY